MSYKNAASVGWPAFITFHSPYGGLGLKTRSAAAARRRIDDLIAARAVDPVLEMIELQVAEPVAPTFQHLGMDTAYSGHGRWPGLDTLVRERGHSLDELAAAAWAEFGTPNAVSFRRRHGTRTPAATDVMWEWLIDRDLARAAAAYPTFCAFLLRHDKLVTGDESRVRVHGFWRFRLRGADGTVAAEPYPPSTIRAFLRARNAAAFFDLVFPHAAVDAGFVADYRAVCDALGMALPPAKFRLDAPTRTPGTRKINKLPAF